MSSSTNNARRAKTGKSTNAKKTEGRKKSVSREQLSTPIPGTSQVGRIVVRNGEPIYEPRGKDKSERRRRESKSEEYVGAREHAGGVVDLDRLLASAKAMQDPFNNPPVPYPVCRNPAPSMRTGLGRTSVTLMALVVPPSKTCQLTMFPRPPMPANDSGVEQVGTYAFGGSRLNVQIDSSTVNMWTTCGPFPYSGEVAIAGVVSNNLTLGKCVVAMDYNASTVPKDTTVIPWDVPLPYTGNVNNDSVRFQPTAFGTQIYNVTQTLNRGGSIVSYVPQHRVSVEVVQNGVQDQSSHSAHATYKVHGDGCQGVYIPWMPRKSDEGFYIVEAFTDNNIQDAGQLIWFNNTTTVSQTYVIAVAAHWEVAGRTLSSVTSTKINRPANTNITQPVQDIAHEKGALEHAYDITKHVLSKGAEHAYNFLSGVAVDHMQRAMDRHHPIFGPHGAGMPRMPLEYNAMPQPNSKVVGASTVKRAKAHFAAQGIRFRPDGSLDLEAATAISAASQVHGYHMDGQVLMPEQIDALAAEGRFSAKHGVKPGLFLPSDHSAQGPSLKVVDGLAVMSPPSTPGSSASKQC